MREFLQEKALTNNVTVCDSQKNNSLAVHVLNYKGNTSQPEKKQLVLYAVKDVVDHSIHSWGRYKDCGHIITKQIYTDGIVVLYRLFIVSLFSPLRIYFMIWITSNLVKACFIDHIKGTEQQEKHYTVNIDIFVCNL